MKLRIIAGTLKGRNIKIVGNADDFRPTLGRVRRSLADALQPWIYDSAVIDLCAGSGALGFEMLSRGARKIDFVESDRRRGEALLENIRQLRVESSANVFRKSIQEFLKRENPGSRYDIVLYDPPYDSSELTALAGAMTELVSPDGIFVFQHATGTTVAYEPWREVGFAVKTRKYGRTTVDFFVRETDTHKGGDECR